MHKKGGDTLIINLTLAYNLCAEKHHTKKAIAVPYGTQRRLRIMIHSVPIHLSVARKLFHVYNQSSLPKVFGNKSASVQFSAKASIRPTLKRRRKIKFTQSCMSAF